MPAASVSQRLLLLATIVGAAAVGTAFTTRLAEAQMTPIAPVLPTPWLIRGLVRDQITQRPIQGGAVVVYTLNGVMRCTTTSDFGGRFRCAVPLPGKYEIDVRHIGYAPQTTVIAVQSTSSGANGLTAGTPLDGDTTDVTIDIENSPAALDTVRVTDTTRLNGLLITHGRVVFEKHMMLGKGHFISAFEMSRSANTLSEFIGRMDSMKIVSTVLRTTPVIPIAGGRYLTSTMGSQCLYGRVDHQDLGSLMRQQHRENLDALVPLVDVVAVEVYLNFHDVPPDWKGDVWPDAVTRLTRQDRSQYTMGVIGMQQGTAGRPGRATTAGRAGGAGARGRATDPTANVIPTCPFIQIWTKIAW